ncbi:hypothetical protein GF402_04845 [Candidatus Fermentibacteria bacterium]|nr:hypothetical protein [Candidatus Fermentibacteria bacterium]
MPRFPTSLFVLIRIALLWTAVAGYGKCFHNVVGSRRRYDPAISLFYGLLFLYLISFPISLLHLLRPLVLSIVLGFGVLVFLIASLKKSFRGPFPELAVKIKQYLTSLRGMATAVATVLLLTVVLSNFLRAARPNDHSDPLITYAVQPDRWLDEGRIFFLEETHFSLMPLVGETFSLWPASLALDKIDRLSLLQCFQMSLIIAALYYAWKRLDGRLVSLPVVLLAALVAPKIAGWGALAKIDMTLAFFCTVALTEVIEHRHRAHGNAPPTVAFLAMGLALSTKLTAWMLLPSFLLLAIWDRRWLNCKRILLCLFLMLLFPLCYMARTYLHSGTLIYSSFFPIRPDDFWHRASVPALDALYGRQRASLLTDVWALVSSWHAAGFMFAMGLLNTLRTKRFKRRMLPILVAVAVLATIFIIVLSPLQWGAKYTLFVIPLLAASGTAAIRNGKALGYCTIALAVFTVLEGSIWPRLRFTAGFITSPEELRFDTDTYWTPREIQEWAAKELPRQSVLLSLSSGERYFAGQKVICARTHPYARRLFLDDGLESELEILERLDVDYVYFVQGDPLCASIADLNYWKPEREALNAMRENLSILDHVGQGRVLEPIHQSDIYLICRLDYSG